MDSRVRGTGRRILLVMREPDAARMLSEAFAFYGHECDVCESGPEALAQVQRVAPDLIVLDLQLPDTDGLVLCADLRERSDAAIVACGEAGERREALLAFRLGADDFVTKPYDVDDLIARSIALLRRRAERPSIASGAGATRRPPAPPEAPQAGTAAQPEPPRMPATAAPAFRRPERSERVDRAGDLRIDHAHHRVTVSDREVRLSRSEYILLSTLFRRPNEMVSRQELAQAVWGSNPATAGRPIDQHMYRLRTKLNSAAREGDLSVPPIVAVPGFGYRLVVGTALAATG